MENLFGNLQNFVKSSSRSNQGLLTFHSDAVGSMMSYKQSTAREIGFRKLQALVTLEVFNV